jgi:hypothetical protein
MVGVAMRVIAVAASGFVLAACSMSMPGFMRSAPPTEVLRIESEPPGADARTAEGQSCRTPCELTVPATSELAISFALQGYQPQTISVRAEATPGASNVPGAAPTRLQPNPVYAELAPTTPPKKNRKSPPRKKVIAKKAAPPPADAAPPPAAPPPAATPKQPPSATPDPATAYPSSYPWPPPPPPAKQ